MTDADQGNTLTGASCPSIELCVAVDASGNVVIGAPQASEPEATGYIGFTESGIPGENWGVTIDGASYSAEVGKDQPTLEVQEPVGSYEYAVDPPPGDIALPATGLASVSSSDTTSSPAEVQVAIAPASLSAPSVSGPISDEPGLPAPGAPVRITGTLSLATNACIEEDGACQAIVPADVPIQLTVKSPSGSTIATLQASTVAGGEFASSFTLPPGTPTGSGYSLVASVGGVSSAPTSFDVSALTPGSLTVRISPSSVTAGTPVTISGELRDGAGGGLIPGALVAVSVTSDAGGGLVETTLTTASDGSYTLTLPTSGLAPGSYRVSVFSGGTTAPGPISFAVTAPPPPPEELFSLTVSQPNANSGSYTVAVYGSKATFDSLVSDCTALGTACTPLGPVAGYLLGSVGTDADPSNQVVLSGTPTYPLSKVVICPGAASTTCADPLTSTDQFAAPIVEGLLKWAYSYWSCYGTNAPCQLSDGLGPMEQTTSSSWSQENLGQALGVAFNDVQTWGGVINDLTSTLSAGTAEQFGGAAQALTDAVLAGSSTTSTPVEQQTIIGDLSNDGFPTPGGNQYASDILVDLGEMLESNPGACATVDATQLCQLLDDVSNAAGGVAASPQAIDDVRKVLQQTLRSGVSAGSKALGAGVYTAYEAYFVHGLTANTAGEAASSALGESFAKSMTDPLSLTSGLGVGIANAVYIQPYTQLLQTEIAYENEIGGVSSPCAGGLPSGGVTQRGLAQQLAQDLCAMGDDTYNGATDSGAIDTNNGAEATALQGAVASFMADWANTDIEVTHMEYLRCLAYGDDCGSQIREDESFRETFSELAEQIADYDAAAQNLSATVTYGTSPATSPSQSSLTTANVFAAPLTASLPGAPAPGGPVPLSTTLSAKNGKVALTLSCPATTSGGGCDVTTDLYATAGTLPATATATAAKTKPHKKASRARLLGAGRFTIPAGSTLTVRLTLNKAGRKLTSAHSHFTARLIVTSQSGSGQTETHRYAVTVLRAVGARRTRHAVTAGFSGLS